VLDKVVEMTTDDRIGELVRRIDEALVGELADNDEEPGLLERNDERATEVGEGVVV
jgi:hypothetical protein